MSEIVDSFYIENSNWENRASALFEYLKRMSVDEIVSEIEYSDKKTEEISPANVSQFSNISTADYVVQIVDDAIDNIDFAYVGYMINKSSSEAAQRKYGENHLKLAVQMGLVSEKPYKLTPLGEIYIHLKDSEKKSLRPKLFLRIPVVQRLLIDSKIHRIDGTKILMEVLSESTAIRRRSNIKKLIEEIQGIASIEMQRQIADNINWS